MRVVVYRTSLDVAVEEVSGGSYRTAKGPVQEVRPSPSPCGVPPLDQAPGPYATFDPLIEGYTKVILEPEFP